MAGFMKWPGNKTELASAILAVLPGGTRLVEPFAGSAAVWQAAQDRYERFLLSDINADLMSVYWWMKRDPDLLLNHCLCLFEGEFYRKDGRYYQAMGFYDLRTEFNSYVPDLANIRRAALFVYLVRHCFNGLVRYNQSGKFNAPVGKFASTPALNVEAFRRLARYLYNTKLQVLPWKQLVLELRLGDVVYFDPPYVPISSTSSFTSYCAQPFTMDDQHRLALASRRLAQRGIPVVISNSPAARVIYEAEETRADRILEVTATRRIAANKASRGQTAELLACYGC